MWPATAWDDADWDGNRARGWTVMGRLAQKQSRLSEAAARARRAPIRATGPVYYRITASLDELQYQERMRKWHGGATVLAFLFAHPSSPAVRMLDERGEYFDVRTAETWDLFLPGYYCSSDSFLERQVGARCAGAQFASDWYFSAKDFNMLRDHVERESGRRWKYSGGTDLVLINAWVPENGEPTVDWDSTISGQLQDDSAGATEVSLSNVIERISRDLEDGIEDASYGVGDVTGTPPPARDTTARELMINALGGLAAALGAKALGA